MKRDLKQVINASDVNGKIIKLSISIIDDENVYVKNKNNFTFKINNKELYFNKDGVYEISSEDDENLNITSFSIPDGCMAEYVIEV